MVRLEDVVTEEKFAIVDGPFGTQLHISDFVTEGVPVVGIWKKMAYIRRMKAKWKFFAIKLPELP
jgi:hypothetical protein